MARFSSAVAARSAGEEGTDALLATDVGVVAAMSAAIAALVRIHVLVFIGVSSPVPKAVEIFPAGGGTRGTL
jgi:hypothetical protein